MTFEELQEIAREQYKRIFNLNFALIYSANKDFNNIHFRLLKQRYVYYNCWMVMLKLKFPFEEIIPSIEFITKDTKASGLSRVINRVIIKFNLTILNLPETNAHDIKLLIEKFIDTFTYNLIHDFNVPLDIAASALILEFNREHTLYSILSDKNLI